MFSKEGATEGASLLVVDEEVVHGPHGVVESGDGHVAEDGDEDRQNQGPRPVAGLQQYLRHNKS